MSRSRLPGVRPYDRAEQERAWQASRQVLCGLGVRAHLFRAFRPYVLRLYGASRRWRGEELVVAAERLLQDYAARGLDPGALVAIRYQVFTIAGPRTG